MPGSAERSFVYHCPCGARLKLPRAAIGRKIRCQMCGAIAVAPSPVRPGGPSAAGSQPDSADASAPSASEHPESSPAAAAEPIRVECLCGAKLRIAAALAGRNVKCPKCKRGVAVPIMEPLERAGPVEFCPPESLLYDFAKDEESAPAELPTVIPPLPGQPSPADRRGSATRAAAPADGPACPSCGQRLPIGAKICTDCGIDLKSGRSLITSQEDNLDEIYAGWESALGVLKWIIPVGIFPIASEAFGTARPHSVRGLALLTVLTSVAFWYASCGVSTPQVRNLMLWSGDPAAATAAEDEGDDENDTTLSKAQIEQLRRIFNPDPGEFHAHQLVTHAFLHSDIFHLAGNLLFLIVFGSRVNALLGNIFTLPLYLLFGVAAALGHMAYMAHEPLHPMLGASGAIMGMAGMYLVFFPAHKVHMAAWWRWGLMYGFHLSYRLFTVRGFWVVAFYISSDILATALGTTGGVAHWAHLGGFIAGAAAAVLLLLTRLVNGRGTDLISVVLGRYAWALVGRPRHAGATRD